MVNAEVILVTGGSGFIGQHIIKQLIANAEQLGITEIRSVDLKPFKNTIDISKSSLLRTFVGDICEPESVNQYFKGVTGVFHCAAFVSLQYPPDYEALQRNNVDGTRCVVELCVQHNIPRLVYTSCTSVCMVPFKGSTFSVVINQTESKCDTPNYDVQNPNDFEKAFLLPGYSASKLRAEKIVLNSNGAKLGNRKDYLATTAIRPPLTYGEGDNHFMPNVLQYLNRNGNIYPRIAGAGGKHQFAYAGNIAWGHICAYKTLKASQKAINGLPVFVTDESHIYDVSRLIQKFALLGHMPKVRYSFWYVPHFLFFFFAFLVELLVRLLYPLTKYRLGVSLRGLASFTSSVLMYNRLRASIHMDYAPIVDFDTALQKSANWYARWADENLNKRKSKSN